MPGSDGDDGSEQRAMPLPESKQTLAPETSVIAASSATADVSPCSFFLSTIDVSYVQPRKDDLQLDTSPHPVFRIVVLFPTSPHPTGYSGFRANATRQINAHVVGVGHAVTAMPSSPAIRKLRRTPNHNAATPSRHPSTTSAPIHPLLHGRFHQRAAHLQHPRWHPICIAHPFSGPWPTPSPTRIPGDTTYFKQDHIDAGRPLLQPHSPSSIALVKPDNRRSGFSFLTSFSIHATDVPFDVLMPSSLVSLRQHNMIEYRSPSGTRRFTSSRPARLSNSCLTIGSTLLQIAPARFDTTPGSLKEAPGIHRLSSIDASHYPTSSRRSFNPGSAAWNLPYTLG
ncbi:hypothetical protein NMY22_g9156 [Coprinellus aureogranulatus]|nr:hypothetical protein NMY22_g9156 [Coprinellus aureogranulatus]